MLLVMSIASTVTIQYVNTYRWFYSVSVFVIPFCLGIKGVNQSNIYTFDPSYWKTFSMVACLTFMISLFGIGIRSFVVIKEVYQQKTIYCIAAGLCIANGLVFGVRCYFEGQAIKKSDLLSLLGM